MDTEVVLVRWPEEEVTRHLLIAEQRPHLLLVEAGDPPISIDVLEDWIRVPALEHDIEARLESLRRRAVAMAEQSTTVPVLEEGGILRNGRTWVSLSPLEARLVATLLQRFGAVVTRQALTEAGWPPVDGVRPAPHRNVLDAHILRLRHRLPVIGLTIRTVRSRGYLLEASTPTPGL